MSLTILLTGGSGFIGSAILREAVRRGHAVVALTRSALGLEHERLHVAKGELANAPWDVIKSFRPAACVHSAWISTPGIYLESQVNRDFLAWSKTFLEGAHNVGIQQVVALGTCIEYANTGRKMSEGDSPLAPASLYAHCKNELREVLESNLVPKGLDLAWARIFYPYGPGEHSLRLSSVIVEKLLRGEEVLIKTPGSRKDFIYIDDVAAAIVDIVEATFRGPINVGTGDGTSVLDFANAIGDLLGRRELIKQGSPPSPDPYDFVVADAARLRSLGWRPKVNLEEGLRRLVEQKRLN